MRPAFDRTLTVGFARGSSPIGQFRRVTRHSTRARSDCRWENPIRTRDDQMALRLRALDLSPGRIEVYGEWARMELPRTEPSAHRTHHTGGIRSDVSGHREEGRDICGSRPSGLLEQSLVFPGEVTPLDSIRASRRRREYTQRGGRRRRHRSGASSKFIGYGTRARGQFGDRGRAGGTTTPLPAVRRDLIRHDVSIMSGLRGAWRAPSPISMRSSPSPRIISLKNACEPGATATGSEHPPLSLPQHSAESARGGAALCGSAPAPRDRDPERNRQRRDDEPRSARRTRMHKPSTIIAATATDGLAHERASP